ncbi:MAG: hypothetical protein JWM98_1398 [Thermoleophilia bacterium]|nr:hypothetical protein [Thermoleophilia bacterium]
MRAVGATLPRYAISWAEPALFGRTVQHQLTLVDVADGGWPTVSSYAQGTVFNRSEWLDPGQVASIADARTAVELLRSSWAALRPEDLPAPDQVTVPRRGTMRFEDPFAPSGAAAVRFVTISLDTRAPRLTALVDAARGLAHVVQRESGR